MIPGLQGVLFDNDGTLVDTYQLLLVSFRYATQKVLGYVPPDEVLMASVGTPLADQMYDFTDDPATAQELLVVYREYNHKIHDQMVAPFAGMEDALAACKRQGLALGVVTSKLHALAWHGLEVTGLSEYFDFLIGPDDWPEHKPKPGPILRGCQLMGISPETCAYVGDSPFDIQAGNAAGAVSIAALWGMFPPQQLRAQSPDYMCESVSDLQALLAE